MSSHHIQIGDISPRIQYTGDGSQVAFTYPFPIFKDADIEVFEDTTLKTLTTDYSVSGAGNSSGGTVTFVTAPLTGVVVTLKRNITIARTSDFDESGAFRSKVINDELDTITAVQQQIQDSIERSLRLSDTDTAGTLTLPEKDTRKGKFLRFDDTTGDPEAADVTGVTVLSDTNAQDIGTAAPGTSGDVSRADHLHALPDDGVTTAKIIDGAVTAQKIASDVPQLGKNAIIDGGFVVADEAASMTAATTPANDDDTYFNNVLLLSDGDDIVDLSRETTIVPAGGQASWKCLVATANKKFGLLMPLEARDSARFAGGTASLSFKARTTTGAVIENLRAAVLSWDGTADSITSDVVSAWNAEGADPTFTANWTVENTPANIVVTADAFATHKIENVGVDTAGMKNIAVFIWLDDTDAAANDVVYVSEVQLENGDVATDFERLPVAVVAAISRRLYEKIGDGTALELFGTGVLLGTTSSQIMLHYGEKRITNPAVAVSDQADFQITTSGSFVDTTVVTASVQHDKACMLSVTMSAIGGAGSGCLLRADGGGNARITVSARL